MQKLLMIALLVFVMACSPPATPPVEQEVTTAPSVSVQPASLIGKTIEYKYGEAIYHVTLDSDSTLHWEGMAGDEKGVKADETYFMESLDSARIFIMWDEANGIGVSQVLDFAQGKVYNHLMQDRKLRHGYGEIRVLEQK